MNLPEYFYKTSIEKDPAIFECPTCYHIGDKIGLLNMHSYFAEKHGLNAYLNLHGVVGDDLLLYKALFKPQKFTEEPANIRPCVSNDVEYFGEVFKHTYNILSLPKTNVRYVSYSFSCNYRREDKTPGYINDVLEHLKSNFEVIEVGKHMSIDRVIEYINNSIFFIGLDNGMSHLCRCIDTPHIMIEYKFPLSYAFPREYYQRYIQCNSLEETIREINAFKNTTFLQ